MRRLLVIALFFVALAASQCTYTDPATGRQWYFMGGNNAVSDYEFPRNEYGQYLFFQPCAATFACQSAHQQPSPLCMLDDLGKWHSCGALGEQTFVPGENWLDVVYSGGSQGRSTTVRVHCGDQYPGEASIKFNGVKNYTVQFHSEFGCYHQEPKDSSTSASSRSYTFSSFHSTVRASATEASSGGARSDSSGGGAVPVQKQGGGRRKPY